MTEELNLKIINTNQCHNNVVLNSLVDDKMDQKQYEVMEDW